MWPVVLASFLIAFFIQIYSRKYYWKSAREKAYESITQVLSPFGFPARKILPPIRLFIASDSPTGYCTPAPGHACAGTRARDPNVVRRQFLNWRFMYSWWCSHWQARTNKFVLRKPLLLFDECCKGIILEHGVSVFSAAQRLRVCLGHL